MNEGPKKKQTKKPADRLGVLFTQVQLQYAEQNCKNRLSNLKLSMLTDPQKPWSKYATLDAKGGETRHLLPALTPVIKTAFAETMNPAEENMIAVLESLEKLVKLWDDAGIFLTSQEYAKSLGLASTFLAKYQWLHLCPTMHWCWKGEDFVGQISRLTHSVSIGVSSVRLPCKVAPKYGVLTHLYLTRSISDDTPEELNFGMSDHSFGKC